MARVVDTLAAFEVFARKAGLETPIVRESIWQERYEGAHPDVFEAFYATEGSPSGRAAVVRELSRVRARVNEAAPVVREAIRDIDPALPGLLGLASEPSPVHVVMVGTFTTNASVGRLGDDVAVFHCLEWFQTADGARVLVAHEGTHAWHELALRGATGPTGAGAAAAAGAAMAAASAGSARTDPAWTALSEGLAIASSRAAVPGRPEMEYFWYGHPEDTWLPWCQENREALLEHFGSALEAGADTVESYFGGGMIDAHWRVGFYLADELVSGLGLSLPELAAMSVDEGRAAIRSALGADPPWPAPEPSPGAA